MYASDTTICMYTGCPEARTPAAYPQQPPGSAHIQVSMRGV